MTLPEYLRAIDTRYRAGNATEHTYRGDLQHLLTAMTTGIVVTNEPRRVACGAPDYILTRQGVPVGYIEAKDIGKPLESKDYKEQFDRYKKGLDNLIITDYLDFRWYRQGERVQRVQLAEVVDGKVRTLPQNVAAFEELIKDFVLTEGLTIRSAGQLAEMMAGKARMMDEVIKNALMEDTEHEGITNLSNQYGAFRRVLLHDLTVPEFADIYAQTVTYGMFAARLHDKTPETFSRQEAAELIPKTNPFLRWLFADIAGPNIDERIVWIVDALADIFRHTDMEQVLKTFGRATGQNDPLIHFYEPFLAAYSPALRKSRGVWYTPQPVVNFIVRAVDDILKTEFGLSQGLADTSKVKVKVKATTKATADARSKVKEVEGEKEVHRVQILDPATGTGTFLAEVIRQMHAKFEGMEGMWPQYVDEHLLPRINGFELLMASYAMAHLKLDMVLRETGVDTATLNKRLKVFLTNSLEEANEQMPDLFSAALATEAAEANRIKNDTPVMVVLGNPPYAVSSTNKSEWIQNLIADYKKGLNERKINLDDDYIKFIRYGQHFIEKNGEGVLAYISNSSFIDGITHRQMRKSLLDTFDKIFIIDLHGSSKKQEKTLDGGKDENVFDIQQGVSITILVKSGNNTKTKVYHSEIFGNRSTKYDFLSDKSMKSMTWKELNVIAPNYFFIDKDLTNQSYYDAFAATSSLFRTFNSGIKTDRDSLFYDFKPEDVKVRFQQFFQDHLPTDFITMYRVVNSGSYNIIEKRKGKEYKEDKVYKSSFRPFDDRYIYYDPEVISRPAQAVMKHLSKKNIVLLLPRQAITEKFGFFISDKLCDVNYSGSAGQFGAGQVFPLYLYPDSSQLSTEGQGIRPNLDEKLAQQLAAGMGCVYAFDEARAWQHGQAGEVLPLDILDYIYAVLHSRAYREKYKEFLKIDFPRVPWPTDEAEFRRLVALGAELRQYHLMEHPALDEKARAIGYPVQGSNTVENSMTAASPGFVADAPDSKTGNVFINDTQHFTRVPAKAWEFYIGGYQPAQKWLKDRKGRTLTFDDIQHYRKIIAALSETDRLMGEIDGDGN